MESICHHVVPTTIWNRHRCHIHFLTFVHSICKICHASNHGFLSTTISGSACSWLQYQSRYSPSTCSRCKLQENGRLVPTVGQQYQLFWYECGLQTFVLWYRVRWHENENQIIWWISCQHEPSFWLIVLFAFALFDCRSGFVIVVAALSPIIAVRAALASPSTTPSPVDIIRTLTRPIDLRDMYTTTR